jgi:hypothetical protein
MTDEEKTATWGTWSTTTEITGAPSDRLVEKIGLKWEIRTLSYLDLDTNYSWFVIEHTVETPIFKDDVILFSLDFTDTS